MKQKISVIAATILFITLAIIFFTRQEFLPSIISGFFAGYALSSMQMKIRKRSKSFPKNRVDV